MISDVFPELMAGDSIVRHLLIWESSRFCVDHTKALQRSALDIRIVTSQLLIGAFKTAQAAGIQKIISAADILVARILKNCGCPIEKFGQPYVYGTVKTIVGFTEVNASTIARLSDGLTTKELADL